MAHTVYIGSFSKKLNSTAQPTYTSWSSYSCVFKDDTSMNVPTIRLNTDFATFASSNYNYAVMLGRYYWITDVRSLRNSYVEVDLSLDALATYKSNILSTSSFIEYGFNTFDAGDSSYRVADSRQPISKNPSMSVTQLDPSGGIIDPTDGCYVVQAVGNAPNTGLHQGLATFCLSQGDLAKMMKKVNTTVSDTIDDFFTHSLTPQEVANELMRFSYKQELLNESALAAIQSVMWLPFDISGAEGTDDVPLYLGNFYTNVNALMLDQNDIYHHLSSMTIPWSVTDWRRNNTQLFLYLPFFGTIPIPTDQSIDTSAIGINWTCEYFSGSVSVVVRTGNGSYTIFAGSTNVGVNMGVGRSTVGAANLIGGAIQMLGGSLEIGASALDMGTSTIGSMLGLSNFSNAAQGAVRGVTDIYKGYAQTVQPIITCCGSMGGMAAIGQVQTAILCACYYPPIDNSGFSAKYGHPVFKVATPAAGFCKTNGFSISLPSNSSYAAIINSAMDGGVYIE